MSRSLLKEFVEKKEDAQQRLAKIFGAFIRTEKGFSFVCGSNTPATRVEGENFGGVIIGETNKDTEEMTGLFRQVTTSIQQQFSEADVHPKLVIDIMSDYLHWLAQDMRVPQALASEVLLFDSLSKIVYQLRFDGDFTQTLLSMSEQNIFFVGAYAKSYQVILQKNLLGIPTLEGVSKDPTSVNRFVAKLKKVSGMKLINILAVQSGR